LLTPVIIAAERGSRFQTSPGEKKKKKLLRPYINKKTACGGSSVIPATQEMEARGFQSDAPRQSERLYLRNKLKIKESRW
jgi:hypothetical protein